MLTGKAKQDFEEWFKEQKIYDFKFGGTRLDHIGLNHMMPIRQMPLIIDWLDSVGIYIVVFPWSESTIDAHDLINPDGTWSNQIYDSTGKWLTDTADAETRVEATSAAIITANDIYNGMDKH